MASPEDHDGVVGICRHAASFFRRGIPLLLTLEAISSISELAITRFLPLDHEKAMQELENMTVEGDQHSGSPSALAGWNNLLVHLLFKAAIVWTASLAILPAINSYRIGTIAYSVVAVHMGKRPSIRRSLACGLKAGIARLMWLNFLSTVSISAAVGLAGMIVYYHVAHAENREQMATQYLELARISSLFNLNRDGANTSLHVLSLLILGLCWASVELLEQVYAVARWVVVLESESRVLRAVSRSWRLLRILGTQAFLLWLLEHALQPWLLERTIGSFFVPVLMPLFRICFTLVSLAFYLSARSLCDDPSRFSNQTLEDFLGKSEDAEPRTLSK